MEVVRQSEYYNLGELVVLSGANRFELTDDCIELLSTVEDDIIFGEEQRNVYQKLYSLTPALYSKTREFLVLNPVCTEVTLREFKLKYAEIPAVSEVISSAYEPVQKQSYRCPSCGWTMTFSGMQAACCNRSCTKNMPSEADFAAKDMDAGCRLKRNTASTPALDREAAYINEIKTKLRKVNTRYAAKGTYTYNVSRQQGCMAEKTVRLDVSAPAQHRPLVQKSEREPISVTIAELLESAKKMRSINDEDYCFDVLSKNGILEASGNTLSQAKQLEIRRTTNMVGMVGSGKSTLIKALTYHLSKQGKRIVLVVDTADEARGSAGISVSLEFQRLRWWAEQTA